MGKFHFVTVDTYIYKSENRFSVNDFLYLQLGMSNWSTFSTRLFGRFSDRVPGVLGKSVNKYEQVHC